MNRATGLALSLSLGGLVIVLDTTIAVLAVPVLVCELHSPLVTVQWVTTGYLLALVATMPLAAWLGGRFGHRRVYVAALLVFAVGSAWAGLAHGAGELIAARVLQGLGGGLINPLGMTLGLREVPREHRGRVSAILGLPVLVGPLVGPVLAGWLVDAVSWRAIFFVTVAPALVASLLVLRYAPPDPAVGRDRAGSLDVVGAALMVLGAVGLVVAVAEPVGSVLRVGLLLLAAASLTLFVRRCLQRERPLLQVRLFASPAFAASTVVLVLFAAGYFGSMLLSPTYVQITRGDSALLAGSLGIPGGLATGLSLQVATRLVDRVAPARVVGVGLAVASATSLTGILVLRADTSYWVIALLAVCLGVGSGAVLMPTMTVATRDLTEQALASGSAILALLSQLANAVGTAAVSATFAAMIAWQAPDLDGGLESAGRLGPAARAAVAPDLVTAQRLTQGLVLTLFVVALAVAVCRLPRRDGTPEVACEEAMSA